MELRGTEIESEFRDRLVRSNEALFNAEECKDLLNILREVCAGMKTAYILRHIPDQDSDWYVILVNDDKVVKIELRHDNNQEPVIEVETITQYLNGLKKQRQIQLAVALDLVKRDGERNK
ncbi:hypothetical protein [Chitinophaga sp. S165]|uniref:hypothetical protein n=1 Tax=Chitinophaga sp. S165 TaxID=2135462 RepID=UPI000D7090FA|nr:hypothetical protein [Chitinophaga sp. S165]PWV56686.1 hypothetical protein C7475_1011203 [Chitinophaga sp. S165]